PLDEYFNKVGWNFYPEQELMVKSFGKMNFKFNPKQELFEIHNTSINSNVFRLENGDQILEINGQPLFLNNYERLLNSILEVNSDNEISIKYKRGGDEFLAKEKPVEKLVTTKFLIEDMEGPSEEQLRLRSIMFFLMGAGARI
nr:hypothetical protein [Bacteroidota bacterium]